MTKTKILTQNLDDSFEWKFIFISYLLPVGVGETSKDAYFLFGQQSVNTHCQQHNHDFLFHYCIT